MLNCDEYYDIIEMQYIRNKGICNFVDSFLCHEKEENI